MDKLDTNIIDILTQNARITNKELAKQLKITEPATIKRVKKLEEQQVISRYDSLLNFDVFNCKKIAYLANTSQISKIKALTSTTTIGKITHKFEYFILCFFKSKKEQTEFEKLLLAFEKYEWENVNATQNTISGNPYTSKADTPKYAGAKPTKAQTKILQAMHEGGARKTIKELAQETKLSIDQAWYNKKQILKSGYFLKFIAQPGSSLNISYTYIFITQKKVKPETLQSLKVVPKVMLTYDMPNGICLGCMISDLKSFFDLKDAIGQKLRGQNYEIETVFFKEFLVLNRYPYEYLLD